MPWYILIWVKGSDICLCQETLYRSESCKRKLRKTLACGPPGMAGQEAYKSSFFPQTIRDWNDIPESLISSAEMSDDCVSKFTSLVGARD